VGFEAFGLQAESRENLRGGVAPKRSDATRRAADGLL
jgi:hypothetical protein